MPRLSPVTRTWLRASPWIAIFAAIAVVQVVRDQPVDATIFGVGAVALVLDAAGAMPARRQRPSLPLTAFVAGGAVVVAVVAVAPRHGIVIGVAVGVVGVVAVSLAWLLPPRTAAGELAAAAAARRVRVRRAAIGWSVVVVLLCLVELWSFLMGRLTAQAQGEHPAVSELLDPALDSPLGKAVFAAAWAIIGILLLTRGRRRPDA